MAASRIRRSSFGIAVAAAAGIAVFCLMTMLVAAAPVAGGFGAGVVAPQATAMPVHIPLTVRLGQLPIPFEPNVGQATAQVRYLARANGYSVALTKRGAILKLNRVIPTPPANSLPHRVSMAASKPAFVYLYPINANTHPRLQAVHRLPSISNYFIGNNPNHWHANVPNYAAVRYRNIYPGIDWVVYGNPNRLEYDLAVAPHANPQNIKFHIQGADHLAMDSHGNLVITVGNRRLRELKPVVYQVTATGRRHPVQGRYVLHGRQVAFVLGPYDHAHRLIIDPAVLYSTYLGGSYSDYGMAVAVDSAGDAYVTGQVGSDDFPTTNFLQPPSPPPMNNGGDVFVSKFNSDGSALVYSTYFGGSNTDEPRSIAVDSSGNAYVTGNTFSTDFPTVNAFQATNLSTGTLKSQGFVTKLNAQGNALVYSTYLGGSSGMDGGYGIAVDSAGETYVAGQTESVDFPTVNPYQASLKGSSDAFVTKFDAAGNALVYSTYLGGSGFQQGYAIAIDSSESAYITGITNSTDFPVVNAYQATNPSAAGSGTNPGFVSKLSPAGNVLDYSTYLGGSADSFPYAIAVDSNGEAYVTGATDSTDFPTVNPYQSQLKGLVDAFITKFSAQGNTLVYSTYLGGSSGSTMDGEGRGIAVDSAGDAFVVGSVTATNFPTVNPLQATNYGADIGTTNAFISEFDPSGSTLQFSTYWGGNGSWGPYANHTTVPGGDIAKGVAVDDAGNLYVVGYTNSCNFPTYQPFQATNKTQTTYGTGSNAFITKLSLSQSAPYTPPVCPSVSGGGGGGSTGGSGGGATDWLAILALGFLALWRLWEFHNKY